MPPQVVKADPGTPVNSQAPVSIEQSKTTEVDKTAAQKQEPPKEDAQTAAKNAEAAKQHATSKKQQNVADEQMVRNTLDQKVPEKKTDKAATTAHSHPLVERDRKLLDERDRKLREMKLEKKGAEIYVELQRVGSGRPSFEESERLIQKIDAYKREIDSAGGHDRLNSLYFQQIEKPTRMETRKFGVVEYKVKSELPDEPVNVNHMKNLLGAYGYDEKRGESNPGDHEGRITQHQVLDTALHNWRATPPEQRRTLHGFDGPPAKLPKGWKTPHDMREANQKTVDEQITAKEVYGKLHYDSPQKHQPNPDDRMADLQHESTQTGWNIIAAGPTHGTPRPNLGSTPTISSNRTAPPPEPVSVVETQPRSAKPITRDATAKSENTKQKQDGIHRSTNPNQATTNTERTSESNAKLAKKPLPQDGLTAKNSVITDPVNMDERRRRQERVVEDAIGQLDDAELLSLRDRLVREEVLQPGKVNGKVHPEQVERIRRDERGMRIPGDRETIIRETREAIEKTTDPETIEILERRRVRVGQRETSIAHELRELRDARTRAHVENPGAKFPQEKGYPTK